MRPSDRGDGMVVLVGWYWLLGKLRRWIWADSTAHHGFDVFMKVDVSAPAGRDQPIGQFWQCSAFLMGCPKCTTLPESPYNRSEGLGIENQSMIWGCSSIANLAESGAERWMQEGKKIGGN
jgi:hypothetical protein